MAAATLLRPLVELAPPLGSAAVSISDDEGDTSGGTEEEGEEGDPATATARRRECDRRLRAARSIYGGRLHHSSLDDDDHNDQPSESESAEPILQTTFELAGVVFAAHVSPLPLLAPYACASLSPSPTFFLPLLLLAGLMSWLAHLVIALQARYVGATSFPDLAAAALPRRPAWLSHSGQALASFLVVVGSVLRTTMGLVASAEIAVDLLGSWSQIGRASDVEWDRAVAVGLIGVVWLLFPFLWSPILAILGFRQTGPATIPYTRLGTRSQADLVVDLDSPSASPPLFEREWDWHESHRRQQGGGGETRTGRPRPPRWSALLNLPAWSVAVLAWPIALALFGFRCRYLNRHPHLDDSPLSASEEEEETTTTVWWKAILVTFTMMMGASHETFHYLDALKRPTTTSASSPLALRGRASFPAEEEEGGGSGGVVINRNRQGGGRVGGSERRGRKGNQFPLAMALGLGGACLVHLGWALVGTVGFAAAVAAASPSPGGEDPITNTITAAELFIRFPSSSSATGDLAIFHSISSRPVRIPTGNILSDPRLGTAGTDPYFLTTAVRLLVLFATLAQLEAHAQVGLASVRRFFLRAFFFFFFSMRPRPPPSSACSNSSSSSSSRRIEDEDDDGDGGGGGGGGGGRGGNGGGGGGRGRLLSRVLARTGFYALVVLCGWATIALLPSRERPNGEGDGGKGTGLVRLAEWSGIGIAGIGGCLVPAFSYLILFHLRKPRRILLSADPNPDPSDPNAPEPFEHDDLLERKEREMQRRLSGRRIGTDLGVFGLLGPVGVVLVARGLVALLMNE